MKKFPDATVKSSELEREHGKLVWSFDLSRPSSRNITEVQVNALTGKISKTEVETPEREAKEAASEKKEAASEQKDALSDKQDTTKRPMAEPNAAK